MTEATNRPLSGLWQPTQLQKLHYGPGSVSKHLISALPSSSSKAFIITGTSLATRTPLVRQVEELLGQDRHAGTFSKIGEHAPVVALDQATELVGKDESIDTVISIGGGSPIDSAKAVSYRLHEKTEKYLYHIAIPTTLSAGECTMMAGYTESNGVKTGVRGKDLVPHVVLYDASFAEHTPERLWLSTGLRALDHAVELLYHPTASEMPARWMTLQAAGQLFEGLVEFKEGKKEDTITRLQLASFASLGFLGTNIKGGLGLSHALGYALGSPYGIPHGITSCLTLGHVVKLKAEDAEAAEQIARLIPFIGEKSSGDNKEDAKRVGDRILELVRKLELDHDLKSYKVGQDQIPIIVKRAIGKEEGEMYDKVEELFSMRVLITSVLPADGSPVPTTLQPTRLYPDSHISSPCPATVLPPIPILGLLFDAMPSSPPQPSAPEPAFDPSFAPHLARPNTTMTMDGQPIFRISSGYNFSTIEFGSGDCQNLLIKLYSGPRMIC
ncbi:Dehydroquinate synthase-like protein [Delitschia confertaspora ATCC 74209]|uniref:Dehydroquinate synthase-like protein n=1 Tax=Delitschia confertaspora ATCC 74209 TaxID=1513339 RepID=A0A9P4MSI3_9PLEO|nr:Dehydroquinate synthase-like protein [Delitschia confertaspora ATCC 74209]